MNLFLSLDKLKLNILLFIYILFVVIYLRRCVQLHLEKWSTFIRYHTFFNNIFFVRILNIPKIYTYS